MKNIEELEQDLLAVTSRLTLLDQVLRDAGLGRATTIAFRCNHSGMLFPSNYVKEWGKLYGIGLGPEPVSECLDSDYDTAPPEITSDIRSFSQIMHPLMVSKSQVDMVKVPVDSEDYLVLASSDPYLEQRAALVRQKQFNNPRSRLKILRLRWESLKGEMK